MSTRKYIVNRGGGWPVDENAPTRYPLGMEVSLKSSPEVDAAVEAQHLIPTTEAKASGVVAVEGAEPIIAPVAPIVAADEPAATAGGVVAATDGTEAASDVDAKPRRATKRTRTGARRAKK